MNENEIYPEEPIDATDTIDDVEGHGLKEVAAGLGAAAVLAGGAAGATQLASSSVNVHPSSSPGVSVSVSDPIGTANHLSDNAVTAAQHDRDAAETLAVNQVGQTGQRVADVKAAASGAVKSATNLADATTTWAGDVTQATKNLATSEVSAAKTLAAHEASSATSIATTTADNQLSHATATAGSTVRDVDRKVATVLSVVTTTAADGVNTAKITLNAVDAGAGANTSSAGGWVLIKAGDTVLAQVQMNGGTATANWKAPVAGGWGVQVSYTGDNVFAPSARALTL